MKNSMLDALIDALIDSAKLIPFLLITYLVLEFLEKKMSDRTRMYVRKSRAFGPLVGGVLGIIPQCGFSAAAANLFASHMITRGTLIAIFLSTSDEMLPILVSESVQLTVILKILGAKALIGTAAGFLIDLFFRRRHPEGEKQMDIEAFCKQEHCKCDEGEGIILSALRHTGKILVFIFLITLVLNEVVALLGPDAIRHVFLNRPIIAPLTAAAVGLIPNCAGSVAITQLYLEHVLPTGAMLAGLLTGAGVGPLVLCRVNRNAKENAAIIASLYVIGVVTGIIIDW